MNSRSVVPDTWTSKTSTSGSCAASRRSISGCRAVLVTISSIGTPHKKSGLAPTPGTTTGQRPGANDCVFQVSTVWVRSAAARRRRAGPRAVAIDAVVAASGLQAGGKREGLAGLRVTTEHLQRAAQAEQREVVGRSAIDHRLELGRRLLVALGAEQRAPERLADRGLVGIEIARAAERDRRLVVVAGLEQFGPSPEQVVYVVHRFQFRVLIGRARPFARAGGGVRAAVREGWARAFASRSRGLGEGVR